MDPNNPKKFMVTCKLCMNTNIGMCPSHFKMHRAYEYDIYSNDKTCSKVQYNRPYAIPRKLFNQVNPFTSFGPRCMLCSTVSDKRKKYFNITYKKVNDLEINAVILCEHHARKVQDNESDTHDLYTYIYAPDNWQNPQE